MALFRRAAPGYETFHSAQARYESTQPGIVSRHAFSTGAYYDPANVSFGALTGVDEHLVEPGHGFDEHAHRGVEILSWVLEGTLRHEDGDGRVELVEPGTLLWQSTGAGIRHTESNASATEELRFVQLTLIGGAGEPRTQIAAPPLLVPGIGLLAVLEGKCELELASAYLHITRGAFSITGLYLQPGDAVRFGHTKPLAGAGEALLWTSGTVVGPANALSDSRQQSAG